MGTEKERFSEGEVIQLHLEQENTAKGSKAGLSKQRDTNRGESLRRRLARVDHKV